MTATIVSILVFMFGAIIGSFLNVVILRYRSGRSLGGRSGCFTCGKQLSWFELVPIGSFATQGGKCSGCKTRISWQYPIVEALTGFLFVLLYLRFEYLLLASPLLFVILFAYYASFVCVLIVLSVYDIRHHILPDRLTFFFAAVAFIGMFFIKGDSIVLHIPSIWQFAAGLILPAPFSLLWLVSKGKWMGLGDAKLMIGIGFLLGFSGGLFAILLSFWIGALISVLLMLGSHLFSRRPVSLKTAIPFGPFLALGTILTIVGDFNLTDIARIFSFL